MSRLYTYHCQTCEIDADAWMNHGDAVLRDLAIMAWPHLRLAYANAGAAVGWLEIGLLGYDGLVDFLREHDGHELWLWDEYGSDNELLISPQLQQEPEND